MIRPWVLLPVYNEAATLPTLLDAIQQQGHRVLVVDDGSKDHSAQLAAQKGVRVLRMGKNCGKGAALKRGFEFLLGQPHWNIVVIMDSDGQHDPYEIEKFIQTYYQTDADVIVGTRMGSHENMPRMRYWTNRFTSRCISALAGQTIEDSQCGFRSLRRHVVLDLQLTCDRFDLESEMLIQAGAKGHKIASVPIQTIYLDETSRIRPIPDTARFCRLMIQYAVALQGARIVKARALQPAGATDPL